jgi:hypothetical protein
MINQRDFIKMYYYLVIYLNIELGRNYSYKNKWADLSNKLKR